VPGVTTGLNPYPKSSGHPVPSGIIPFNGKCQEIGYVFNGPSPPIFPTKLKIYSFCGVDYGTGTDWEPDPIGSGGSVTDITIPANSSCGCIRQNSTGGSFSIAINCNNGTASPNQASTIAVAIQGAIGPGPPYGVYNGGISISLKIT
jgi:hypothetical protein